MKMYSELKNVHKTSNLIHVNKFKLSITVRMN